MVDAGIAVGIAVGVAIFLFLLWMLSVPICGAPRPVSTVFALLARSIKKRKKWGYTVVDGGRIVLGSVPRSHEHLLELRREEGVVRLNWRKIRERYINRALLAFFLLFRVTAAEGQAQ